MASSTRVLVRIVSNDLPAIVAAVGPALSREVGAAGHDVEARAKQLVPVKTGTLRRSIHTVGPGGQPWKSGDMRAIVGPTVEYGLYVELGTRHMAARPYMRPAAEAVAPRFADAVRRVLRGPR